MITYKTGDVMKADEVAIAHGCNTRGVMGAGVARLVRSKHPEVYYTYEAACSTGRFRVGSALPVFSSPAGLASHWIYNLGTQRDPGPDATPWGIFLSFANMAEDAFARGIGSIAIPRIGAGIGGLDWEQDVVPAIKEALDRSSHPNLTIVVYSLENESW